MWRGLLAVMALCFLVVIGYTGFMVHEQLSYKEFEVERLDKYKPREYRKDLPHVGYLAPQIALPNRKGAEIRLHGEDRRPAVLVFWTSWSSHCQQELAKLTAMYELYGDSVRFLLVNDTAYDEEQAAFTLTEKMIFADRVLLDQQGTVSDDYSIQVYPTVLLADDRGQIVSRWTGSLSEQTWREKLESLLLRAPQVQSAEQ